jgi:hypothetical protein
LFHCRPFRAESICRLPGQRLRDWLGRILKETSRAPSLSRSIRPSLSLPSHLLLASRLPQPRPLQICLQASGQDEKRG